MLNESATTLNGLVVIGIQVATLCHRPPAFDSNRKCNAINELFRAVFDGLVLLGEVFIELVPGVAERDVLIEI